MTFEEFSKDYQNTNTQALSMAESIAVFLRNAILMGVFKDKKKISAQAIAKKMNVSRTPVREAFRRLESEGLVNIIPQSGVTLSKISVKELQELLEIRVCIEKLALQLAFDNYVEEDFDRMESILKKKEHDSESNMEFHELLYSKCSNTELVDLVLLIRGRFSRYLHLYTSLEPHSIQIHRDILAACRQRNREKALELLEYHINSSGAVIVNSLKKAFNENT